MNLYHRLNISWPILRALITLLLFVPIAVGRTREDPVQELSRRLTKLGVPVKSVTIDRRIPFQITITLQSTTTGNHRTEQDAWNEFLTEREVALAHKFGLQLDS